MSLKDRISESQKEIAGSRTKIGLLYKLVMPYS